jgi:hypothetical protein
MSKICLYRRSWIFSSDDEERIQTYYRCFDCLFLARKCECAILQRPQQYDTLATVLHVSIVENTVSQIFRTTKTVKVRFLHSHQYRVTSELSIYIISHSVRLIEVPCGVVSTSPRAAGSPGSKVPYRPRINGSGSKIHRPSSRVF